jgi:hypothetical protein
MSGAVFEQRAYDAAPDPASPAPAMARQLSEHYCPWCRAMHGFGYCAHASWLTRDALARRGANFNWR